MSENTEKIMERVLETFISKECIDREPVKLEHPKGYTSEEWAQERQNRHDPMRGGL